MARYKINHDYHHRHYHLLEGEVVELSPEDADFVGRDASSLLTPAADDEPLVSAEELDAADEAAEAERSIDEPPSDRMVRGKKKRERRHLHSIEDPESGNAGPMSSADWGARKGE